MPKLIFTSKCGSADQCATAEEKNVNKVHCPADN